MAHGGRNSRVRSMYETDDDSSRTNNVQERKVSPTTDTMIDMLYDMKESSLSPAEPMLDLRSTSPVDVTSSCFEAPVSDAREQRVADQLKCCRCREQEATIILLPCRHLAYCRRCVHGINHCPLCDGIVRDIQQICICPTKTGTSN